MSSEDRPKSNFAQLGSFWASVVAILIATVSLVVSYWYYKTNRLQETNRRVRDTYTKLYDIDVGIWRTVIEYPEIHETLFADKHGTNYQSLDNNARQRAYCVYQITGDMFEYYLLIRDDLKGDEWKDRNNCWTDYMTEIVKNSFGFRKYVKKYENVWTQGFKAEYNSIIKKSGLIASPLLSEGLILEAIHHNVTSDTNRDLDDTVNDNPIAVNEGIGENKFWLSIIAAFFSGWLIPTLNTARRIKTQRQIEMAKMLTDINKANVGNKTLSLYWDKYRTEDILIKLKPTCTQEDVHPQSNNNVSSANTNDSTIANATATPIPLSEFMFPKKGRTCTLSLDDYFCNRNFAYFKLNLFELSFDSDRYRMIFGSWLRYLIYSISNSSFFREIVTAPDKKQYYSPAFCKLLDDSVDAVLLKGMRSIDNDTAKDISNKLSALVSHICRYVHDEDELKTSDPGQPEDSRRSYFKISRFELNGKKKHEVAGLLSNLDEIFRDTSRTEQLRKDIGNFYKYFEPTEFKTSKLLLPGFIVNKWRSWRIERHKTKDIKCLLELFGIFRNINSRWLRSEVMDTIILQNTDSCEMHLPTEIFNDILQ